MTNQSFAHKLEYDFGYAASGGLYPVELAPSGGLYPVELAPSGGLYPVELPTDAESKETLKNFGVPVRLVGLIVWLNIAVCMELKL